MITVPLGAVSRASAAARPAAVPAAGFALPGTVSPAPLRTAATTGTAPLAASLLLFQEQFGADRDDEHARAHAAALLDALRDLQRTLLGANGADPAALARLERLLAHDADAADPRLRAAIRSVALRARIALLHAAGDAPSAPSAPGTPDKMIL